MHVLALARCRVPPEARGAILGISSEHLVTTVAHCIHQAVAVFLFRPGLLGSFDVYLGEVLPHSRLAGGAGLGTIGSRALRPRRWRLIALHDSIMVQVQAVVIVRENVPV